ncbi:hypothetical protein OCU04_009576 [Sclerotinia nivalis]|uniref:Uncharacterized protein n=1 Tax=Sclerotinia nivalis TaxID=352851 RepID=A0A9X0AFH9_9HELO|nr:hypothetical protein OCU04_009576 [Sclerotinia nivalis]
MSMAWKFTVSGVFILGALAVACGVARMYFFIVFLSPKLAFTMSLDADDKLSASLSSSFTKSSSLQASSVFSWSGAWWN